MRKSYWSIIYWDVPTFLSFTCINLLGSLGYTPFQPLISQGFLFRAYIYAYKAEAKT